jgi:uncharacterized protein (TIGR02391 family)
VSAAEWVATIKGPESAPLRDLLEVIESEDSDFSDENRSKAVTSLRSIAPPYADLIWRHLHPSIQSAVEEYFREERYYEALVEGCKQYVADLRAAAHLPDEDESGLFGKALGQGKRIRVADRFREGEPCISGPSANSLENGQRELAKAIWTAFRNPLSHEPLAAIEALGVITHQDCLDALSLMSHLRRRLDDADYVPGDD